MKISKNHKAFTLAEVLIVICVIGFLAVFLTAAVMKSMPDRTKTLFKKAYSTVERTVGELVNDENYYPYDENNIGFLNTVSVQYTNSSGAVASTTAKTKFCELFASKLNLMDYKIGTDVCTNSTSNANLCNMITSDGILYRFTAAKTFPRAITVDINGCDSPNSSSDTVSNRDRFTITVQSDGRVGVTSGSTEASYLKSHSLN